MDTSTSSSNFSVPWGKSSTVALIEKVRDFPAIWDFQSELYKKKLLKRECFKQVADALKIEFPELHDITGGNYTFFVFDNSFILLLV